MLAPSLFPSSDLCLLSSSLNLHISHRHSILLPFKLEHHSNHQNIFSFSISLQGEAVTVWKWLSDLFPLLSLHSLCQHLCHLLLPSCRRHAYIPEWSVTLCLPAEMLFSQKLTGVLFPQLCLSSGKPIQMSLFNAAASLHPGTLALNFSAVLAISTLIGI